VKKGILQELRALARNDMTCTEETAWVRSRLTTYLEKKGSRGNET
jgi:hypothetical protein